MNENSFSAGPTNTTRIAERSRLLRECRTLLVRARCTTRASLWLETLGGIGARARVKHTSGGCVAMAALGPEKSKRSNSGAVRNESQPNGECTEECRIESVKLRRNWHERANLYQDCKDFGCCLKFQGCKNIHQSSLIFPQPTAIDFLANKFGTIPVDTQKKSHRNNK